MVLRVGLVGYGLGGSTFHAPFIAAEPRMELSAVVTSSPQRGAEVSERYRGTRVIASVSELLGEPPQIDLLVVSTPNRTHVELATAGLRSGVPVVVDKPVAPTAAAIRELEGLAARHGVALIPFHNRRWDGDFLTLSGVLADGRLGTVHRVESRYERWQPEAPAGPERAWKRQADADAATGILYDLGTHLVDQAVVLYGRPATVTAEVASRRATPVDDDVFVALGYPDGPDVHLWASAVAADQGPRFRLLGSRGAFVVHGMDVQEAALGAGQAPGGPGWGAPAEESWGRIVGGDGQGPVPAMAGDYGYFYRGVAACLLDGDPQPVAAADAVTVAEIIEAAHRSAREHRVVPI